MPVLGTFVQEPNVSLQGHGFVISLCVLVPHKTLSFGLFCSKEKNTKFPIFDQKTMN